MYYFAILFCTLFVPFAQSLHVPSVVQFENKSEISEFNKIIDTNSESIPDKENNFKSRPIREAYPYNFPQFFSGGFAMASCCIGNGIRLTKTCTNVRCTIQTCQNGHCTTEVTRSNGAHVSCP
ncbi:uncharacterized protein LOC127286619 [Leptopilina boulardi]|uniref:uncharacterized protein LOC127286619 n=1 Tax=Leptopilina boulardi TaxID=63433 RepID=UPI0021F57085|nr:uncharacterized protein LOC127286619 [Leptopilina boulardi]